MKPKYKVGEKVISISGDDWDGLLCIIESGVEETCEGDYTYRCTIPSEKYPNGWDFREHELRKYTKLDKALK